MTQIVVVIDGVPVLVVPIVWQRKLKGTCHFDPVLFVPALLLFTTFVYNQWPPVAITFITYVGSFSPQKKYFTPSSTPEIAI